MEAFATSTGRAEALLKAFGVELGFGIGLARRVHGRIRQAEHHAPRADSSRRFAFAIPGG
jgi:hypothetical protein